MFKKHTRITHITIFTLLFSLFFSKGFAQSDANLIVLKGTVVTPDRILQNGYVVIENNIIRHVYSSGGRDSIPTQAIPLDTKGIIFPGLIDLHSHVTYNVFPKWYPGAQKFANRYQWRYHSDFHQKTLMDPYRNMVGDFLCQMHNHGELRELIGGTTSILTTTLVDTKSGTSCLNGLIRNLDDESQLDFHHLEYLIDVRNQDPGRSNALVQSKLDTVKARLASGRLGGFFLHLGEGLPSDSISKTEFGVLQQEGLLTNKTTIIHGVALGVTEFEAMHKAGASLVWSPHSNIELYGATMDVRAAKQAGLKIALSPDWAITGGSDMLEELHYADVWNKEHFNHLLSDKDLVEMVTRIPAEMAGIRHKLGAIRKGLYADLLVISGDRSNPYSALVHANTNDVKLVLINGSPIYGIEGFMKKFWSTDQLEKIKEKPAMFLKLPLPINTSNSVKELETNLRTAMEKNGTTLAPLFSNPK